MQAIAPGWELKVDRGPDSLWVRVGHAADGAETPPLASELWSLMERHFVHRLVLDLETVDLLSSYLLGQIIVVNKRLREQGGQPDGQGRLRSNGDARKSPQFLHRTGEFRIGIVFFQIKLRHFVSGD